MLGRIASNVSLYFLIEISNQAKGTLGAILRGTCIVAAKAFRGSRIVAQALLAIPRAPPACFAHRARQASAPCSSRRSAALNPPGNVHSRASAPCSSRRSAALNPPGNVHSRASAPCSSRRSAALNPPQAAGGSGPLKPRPGVRPAPRELGELAWQSIRPQWGFRTRQPSSRRARREVPGPFFASRSFNILIRNQYQLENSLILFSNRNHESGTGNVRGYPPLKPRPGTSPWTLHRFACIQHSY